jgi:hypothetical protein
MFCGSNCVLHRRSPDFRDQATAYTSKKTTYDSCSWPLPHSREREPPLPPLVLSPSDIRECEHFFLETRPIVRTLAEVDDLFQLPVSIAKE